MSFLRSTPVLKFSLFQQKNRFFSKFFEVSIKQKGTMTKAIPFCPWGMKVKHGQNGLVSCQMEATFK